MNTEQKTDQQIDYGMEELIPRSSRADRKIHLSREQLRLV